MISATCSRASLRMLGKLADQRARKLLHPPGRSPMTGTMIHRPPMRIVTRYGRMRALSFPLSITLAELNTRGARNKAGPMPELVLASSRSGSTPNVVPPAPAFQSPVRILKRSLVSPQKHMNASPSSATTETFAERSARYHAARERIFAETTEGKVKVDGGEDGATSMVVRNPRGPSPGLNGRGSHGFAERIASWRCDPSTVERKE
jgi:hypothetical protein